MILIEVEANPNCGDYPQMAYAEIESAKFISQVRIEKNGRVEECWVTGVDEGGKFVPAKAQRVTDSGSGTAYLVHGGLWGVRLQQEDPHYHPWDFNNHDQWGEPYLLLGEDDVLA